MSIHVDDAGSLHEDYTAQIIIHGQCFGEITYDIRKVDPLWYRKGFALFCTYCGDVWGTIRVKNSAGILLKFQVWNVSCERHPDSWSIPGSILAHSLINLLDLMPEAVVKREFNLLLEQAS